MHLRFETRGVRSELELQPGTWTVGGGPDDGIRFPGLPERLLELDLSEDRVWVRCSQPRPVGRAELEPGLRRWLLPGERVRLSADAQLWMEPPSSAPATVALVRSLLEPGGSPACSAAAMLTCVAGDDAGTSFPLVGAAPELGRLPGCAVRLRDRAVSRRHLQLVRESGVHRVRDLGGRNRARCNGRWLRSGLLLADGDLLTVGRSLLHYHAAARGAAVTESERAPPAPPEAPSAADAGQRSS